MAVASLVSGKLYRLHIVLLSAMTVVAVLIAPSLGELLQGFVRIQSSSARLLSDFSLIGGEGAALLNSALMGGLCLILIKLSGVSLSGPTFAAFWTIVGFSLFGKTPVNTMPIILGVWIASRIAGKSLASYLIIALFGTALGPLTSFFMAELSMVQPWGLLAGVGASVVVGIILPGVAMAMLKMHEGFSLYNMGMTCGFVGLFAGALITGWAGEMDLPSTWNERPSLAYVLLVPGISLVLMVWGAVFSGKKIPLGLKKLMAQTGRLPSDFFVTAGAGPSLFNAGLMGLLFSGYVLVVAGGFSGPTIGGLLTIVGFASFGKHPANVWSVVLGVMAGTLAFSMDLNQPGALLALLFGTTLAPLAGQFGPVMGFVAGFLHLALVHQTAPWHGGLDLYNNGFAGGLTATLLVALVQWFGNRSRPNSPRGPGALKSRSN